MARSEVPAPEPGVGQVRVAVKAAGVDPSIWHLMTGTPYMIRLVFGLRGPKVSTPGWDVAGIVDQIGEGVEGLQAGDAVFGVVRGGFAQFGAGKAERLVPLPASVSFEQAAAVPTSGVTAVQALRAAGGISAGQRVLVIGAGGGVGCFAVQLAALAGADVTGVCSTAKVDFVRSLGASVVIDYTREDVSGQFDAIIDCAGNRSLRALRRVLAPRGALVIVGGESSRAQVLGVGRSLRAAALSPFTGQRLRGLFADVTREDLLTLAGHLDTGRVIVPLDHTFEFGEAIDAVQYVRDGRPLGKVVVRVSE